MLIGKEIYTFNSDSAQAYFSRAIALAEKAKDLKREMVALRFMGRTYKVKGEYKLSDACYGKALNLCNRLIAASKDKADLKKFKYEKAMISNLVTRNLMEQGFYYEAIDRYFSNIKRLEEINDTTMMASTYNSIAYAYYTIREFEKSIVYYQRSCDFYASVNDRTGVAEGLVGMGIVYSDIPDYHKSLDMYLKAEKIYIEAGDINTNKIVLGNKAWVYGKLGDFKKAIPMSLEALDYLMAHADRGDEAQARINLGELYIQSGNYSQAEKHLKISMAIAKEENAREVLKDAHRFLSELYDKTNKTELAYSHFKTYIAYRDSLVNEERSKQTLQKELKWNYEKKIIADSLKAAAERRTSSLKLESSYALLKQEKTQRYALYGGIALVLIFAGVMFNRFRVTQQQKQIITHQKLLVDEKHKEITDSIHYAERIQRSFLASRELLNETFRDYFILFKPKDVVSGDFYWAASVKTPSATGQSEKFFFVTADSTGHGVPGAIMSILNITSLEEAIKSGAYEPAEILNYSRKTIIERLKKDGSAEGGKDGMDCSLIAFDFKNNTLTYSAANNVLWIIRGNELLEFAPDKMPVGKHDKDFVPFTQHTVALQKDDMVYTMTDGLPDQFGGEKGKKFMYKPLKKLLLSINHLPPAKQQLKISEALVKWQGNLEQVDDITVTGIRI
jgi:serine phosphatase RsbU (regulator of sigma subunit)/tetratricopeptide (TPR) repeat protein